jgi:hypothetical protein
MAAHVRLQGVATSMRHALARATNPFARVLFLAALNVLVVDVLDEVVHVTQVAGPATLPRADGDLLLEVIFVLARVERRARDVAVGVG